MNKNIVKTLALGTLLTFGFSNAQNKPKVVLDNFFNNEKKENKETYVNQIKHELDVLTQVDYNNYFCIIHDMLQWARANDMRTGAGRGSVCGSLVAYLMGITEIDPIQYNLVFERFTNPERVTPCDKYICRLV